MRKQVIKRQNHCNQYGKIWANYQSGKYKISMHKMMKVIQKVIKIKMYNLIP